MKFWVKIVVALCVVLVAAFAVWAFFIREKDEVVAYNEISELVEYKASVGFKSKLEKLEKMNYLKNDTTKVISGDSDSIKEIIKLRDKCLNNDTIKVYDVDDSFLFEYNSYYKVDAYADSFIEYMIPYINNMEGNSSILRDIKSNKKDYINSLKKTIESLELVVECQTTIDGSGVEYDVLYGKYKSFSIEFREYLYNASELMSNILAYFKSAKGGEILLNPYVSMFDAFTRTLKTMTTVGMDENIYLEEPDYANDLFYVTSKIDKLNKGEDIFSSEFTELNYLNAYNNLFNNNPSVLNTVFGKKYIEKKKMADNNNLSEVPDNLHHNVVVILNVLGY